jgi:G-patch domain
MERKSQRDFDDKLKIRPEAGDEVNTTNLRGQQGRKDRSRSQSSRSSSSSGSSDRSSGSATAASSGRFMMQVESSQGEPTLDELHQKLGLAPKKAQQTNGAHDSQPVSHYKPQLTLKRISLKDQSLPEENISQAVLVPIESFGQKLLKDMGMGDPKRDIGLDKRPAQPILFVPRPEGMGIGAVSKQELMSMIRRGQEVTDRDLRARHTDHVIGIKRAEAPENPYTCQLIYGENATIIDGKYQGLLGKIVGGDGILLSQEQKPATDENLTDAELGEMAIVVQLEINSKNVKLLRKQVMKGITPIQGNGQDAREIEEKKRKKHKWVRAGLVCRIISKKYRQGKYMDELGQVIDVPDCYTVSFQTQSQELLEDLEEKHLETVMPLIGEKVMILKTDNVGMIGVLNERKKKENKVTIKIRLDDGGVDYLHMTQEDCCAIVGSKLKG